MIIKIIFLMMSYGLVYSETIDEYVNRSNEDQLWGNGESTYMDPINDFNDFEGIFANAFINMSLDEGKPIFVDCKIIESKKVIIHQAEYYLVRYKWKNKERLLRIELKLSNKKWLVR